MVAMVQTDKFVTNFVITPKSLVICWDHGVPTTIPASNGSFEEIKTLLETDQLSSVPEKVNKALKIRKTSKGKFTVLNGTIVIDGDILPNALSEKLIDLVDSGDDTDRLENFWDNLAQNPTDSAREDLFSFLDANNVPITKDGCFIVYKMVQDNWWDKHTGSTFECKPGNVIEMKREDVDHDRRNTCSAGIHVAAFEYASTFGGGRLVECKVNPRDVVAVPPDYSQQKMRVCKAEVLRETDTKYTETVYNNDNDDGRIVDTLNKLVMEPDSKGRIRLPGRLVRKLGVGAGYGIEVLLVSEGDAFLAVREETDDENCAKWTGYTVEKDNSVRVTKPVLSWAGLDGGPVTAMVLDNRIALQRA